MSHLDLPLRLTAAGSFAAVPTGSAKEISNSLGVLVATRPGERLCVPGYGTPDPLFGGFDESSLRAAATVWEPRADPTSIEVTRAVDGSIDVTMNLEA